MVRPEAVELLRNNPAADEIVVYTYRSGSLLYGLAPVLKEIRRGGYEYFFSLDLRLRGVLAARLAGIKKVLGPNRSPTNRNPNRPVFWADFLFSRTIELSDEECAGSLVELQQLAIRRAFDIHGKGRITLPPVPARPMGGCESLFQGSGGPLIGLCPRTRDLAKSWPKEACAVLIQRLVSGFGARLYLIGGPEDRAYADEVLELAGKPEGVLNMAGRTSLLDLSALAAISDLAIVPDNGAAHLMANSGLKKIICLLVSTTREKIIDSMPQACFLTVSSQKDEAEGEVEAVFRAVCEALATPLAP
jgi:ADP-heptose:LPS heptosyltransferase